MWVVGDLPKVAVGIGEVAVITAPVGCQRGAGDPPARLHGKRQEFVHVGGAVKVDRTSSPAVAGVGAMGGRYAGVFREVVVTPDGEDAAVGPGWDTTKCALKALSMARHATICARMAPVGTSRSRAFRITVRLASAVRKRPRILGPDRT